MRGVEVGVGIGVKVGRLTAAWLVVPAGVIVWYKVNVPVGNGVAEALGTLGVV